MTPDAAARAAAALTGVLLAGLAGARVFRDSTAVPHVLAAVVLPAAFALVVHLGLRLPARAGTLARNGAGGGALLAYVLLVPAPGRDLLDGPRRLLSGALPLEPNGPEVATLVLATGLAALVAGELALRRSAVLTPLLPAVLLLGAALAVGAAGPEVPLLLPAGLALLAGGLLTGGREPSTPDAGPRLVGADTPRPWGRIAAVALVLALVVPVAALVGPDLPGAGARGSRADARELVAQPVRPQEATSPLVRFPALAEGRADLYRVRGDGPPVALRAVALPVFDGRTWSTGADYVRAGRSLPPGPDGDSRTLQVEVIATDPLPWLPSPGRPTEVSIAGLGVERDTGDLVVPDDRDVPARYTITGTTPERDPAELRAARPAPAPAPTYDLPPALRAAAISAARSATSPFGELAALQTALRAPSFGLADGEDPPGGHGLFAITRLLDDETGTAEQYASAFAVLARSLGADTRVVVGFRPGPVVDGGWDITPQQVHAWPEVRFEGLGWVAFEPTPLERRGQAPGEAPPASDPAVQQAVQDEADEQIAPPRTAPPRGGAPATDTGGSWLPRLLLAGAVVLVLAVLASGVRPLLRWHRRRTRRRAPDPRTRLLGAWEEGRDALRRCGLDVGRTTGDATRAAESALPDAPVCDLGRAADVAAWSGAEVPATAADTAWSSCDAVRTAARRHGRARRRERLRSLRP